MTPSARIAVMSEDLADQIAAGEVVERPAAVVKELVENAVDSGATRIEVELEGGGLTSIRVRDDGKGIHASDLELALRRHATSKLHRAEDLVEIATHGFRGEALASIAAVARVNLRSRQPGESVGHELRSIPGEGKDSSPAGMPVGTQVEVSHLFASVPARRKFMRSEATEVGHCNEAVLRLALVHPGIHFTLRHQGRELMDFPRASADERIAAILARRGGSGALRIDGEHEGVAVVGHFCDPASASRSRNGIFIVVRNRVVKERSLQQIVKQAYGPALAEGAQPVACVSVEPAPGTVDVNVHPQKTEVRFSDPQAVYAAVRQVLSEGLADAPWFAQAPAGEVDGSSARDSVESWTARPAAKVSAGYRLTTRAHGGDYQREKQALKREVDVLRERLPGRAGGSVPAPRGPEPSPPPVTPEGPEYLTCLPGPVAIFRDGEALLAVDLLELRAHLVYRRLARDLGGEGVAAQGLLAPVVIKCSREDVQLCEQASETLAGIGIDLEPFGEDAVVIRALPAQLRHCVDDADVGDLFARVLPWLRLRASGGDDASRESILADIARTRGSDPAPRLARRWVRELAEDGTLDDAPGVRRLSAAELVGHD